MKYRDPETGEFKELYTKAADTLPVGTVVDFDGEEIPAGWEKAEEMSLIKSVDYTLEYKGLPGKTPKYLHFWTETPEGYNLLCYTIKGNDYKSELFQSIISSSANSCGVNLYLFNDNADDVKVTITGIYVKTTE